MGRSTVTVGSVCVGGDAAGCIFMAIDCQTLDAGLQRWSRCGGGFGGTLAHSGVVSVVVDQEARAWEVLIGGWVLSMTKENVLR